MPGPTVSGTQVPSGPGTPAYLPPAEGPSTSELIGNRISAARQAMKDKAAAMKDRAAEASENKARQREMKAAEKQVELAAAERTALQRATTAPVTSPAATPTTKTATKSSTRSAPRTRKARLRLSRIDPWSVMKTAFLLAIALGIVTWVAVFVVWSAIGAAGVFENINRTVQEVLGTPGADPFRVQDYVNTNKVMGFTTLLACADVLIVTALATLGAFLYNLAAALLGGLEVTLASED